MVTADPLAVDTGSRATSLSINPGSSFEWMREQKLTLTSACFLTWELSCEISMICITGFLSAHSHADTLGRPAGGSAPWPNSWLTALWSWAARVEKFSIWVLGNSIRIKPIFLLLLAVVFQQKNFLLCFLSVTQESIKPCQRRGDLWCIDHFWVHYPWDFSLLNSINTIWFYTPSYDLWSECYLNQRIQIMSYCITSSQDSSKYLVLFRFRDNVSQNDQRLLKWSGCELGLQY